MDKLYFSASPEALDVPPPFVGVLDHEMHHEVLGVLLHVEVLQE